MPRSFRRERQLCELPSPSQSSSGFVLRLAIAANVRGLQERTADTPRSTLAALAAAAMVSACLSAEPSTCPNGLLCAPGMVCAPSGNHCVTTEQEAECRGAEDLSSCAYPGVPDGTCFGGVCLPSGCGNGEVEPGEVCDDGERLHGDGCSADCTSDETCGNGVVDTPLGESCDDGRHCDDRQCIDGTPCNGKEDCSGLADDSCAASACHSDGDCAGKGDERCATRDGDDCQANCINPACGDGIRDSDFLEACDLGSANADTPDAECRRNCQPRRCGDGIVDPIAGEECDIGDVAAGDGCSEKCRLEVCGNGLLDVELTPNGLQSKEECDDANVLNHDGCIPACLAEAPTWREVGASSPAGRINHAMALDAARARVILFGGLNAASQKLGDTWEWDGATWTQRLPAASPSPRWYHALAYDSARGVVVLFGGDDGQFKNDTWLWDGTEWSEVATGAAPDPRQDAAMAYDSARDRVVLFGGHDGVGKLGDTWEWNGVTWNEIVPVDSPGPRFGHAMAYDATRGRVVLFGGLDGSGRVADTWEWNGSNWTEITAGGDVPTARNLHAMTYEPTLGQVVVYGGYDGVHRDDMYAWDGTDWTKLVGGTPAYPRREHAMSYDPYRQRIVVFGGGTGSTPFSDTWEWDGSQWSIMDPPEAPARRYGYDIAYDAARAQVVLYGGTDADTTNPLEDTWVWDGRRWTLLSLTAPPGPRTIHVMAYHAASEKVVLFGGWSDDLGDYANDTWLWDGASWSPTSPTDSPKTLDGPAVAYDADRERIVLFGGYYDAGAQHVNETWEWTGTDWIKRTPAHAPTPRYLPAMAYDARRKVTVLLGGQDDDGRTNDTWEWDGTDWSERTPASSPSPSPRMIHKLFYDPARGRVVLFGGNTGALQDDTWEWDGLTWSKLSTTGSPSARDGHRVAYDSVQGSLLLFGGYDSAVINDTWVYRYDGGVREACHAGLDGDGDGLVGCADPDCWAVCTPHCPPGSTPQWPTDCEPSDPHCGDGTCNEAIETSSLCPDDACPSSAVCGDFRCDDSEDAANCPGDCP